MRRDIGLILAGLGAFLIVLAVAMPTYIAGHVVKFPLNYYYKAVLTAPNTTYFSATKVAEVTGANVNAVYTLKGDAAKGNSSTAVWDLFTYIYDTGISGPDQQISIQQRTVAFDRKTAELRSPQSGVVGYVFPMGTQPKTYDVFDTSLNRPVPYTYAGTDNVDGIFTYKFVENVAPTKIGFSPLSSTDPEYYAINLTYWVDPDTGALLKVKEHQQQFLENAITGAKTTTLFDGTLAPTAASVQDIVNIDNSGRLKITLIQTILPIVVGVVGAALLVWGVLLVRRRRDFTESTGFGETTGELSAATPPDGNSSAAAQNSASPNSTGGKHAAPSSGLAGIVPGMEGDPHEASAETHQAENPETPEP